MAMMKCPECSAMVSDMAVACPTCGHPLAAKKKGVGLFGKLLIGAAAVFAFILIVGSMVDPTPRSEARDACANLERMAYTSAEKRLAEDTCAELMREADRKMGRIP